MASKSTKPQLTQSVSNRAKSFGDLIANRLPRNGSLSTEEIFSVLSNRRRRYTLHYLLQNGADTNVSEIAEQLAAWESNTEPAKIDSETRKRTYTALQQNHLPRMADIGVIDFNKDRGTIEPTESLQELDIYLDISQGHQIPWSEYYLLLSMSAGLLVLMVWQVGFPFTLVPPLGWAAVIWGVFTVTSITHVLENRQQKFSTTDTPPELDDQ